MKDKKHKNYALILASGSGSRFGSDMPKQFAKLGDKTVFEHTVSIFQNSEFVDEIIIAINNEYRCLVQELVKKNSFNKVKRIILGGETRKASSYNGIHAIEDDEGNVIIHDCARPFVSEKIIKDCFTALENYDAVTTAIPVTDTIIKIYEGKIESIPKRETLMKVQTPQAFKISLIKRAHQLTYQDNNFTDDCGLVLKYNLADIHVIEGNINNIKITYPQDIYIAEQILS